jgi:CxxC motif-containing protein (DUF1111 family)
VHLDEGKVIVRYGSAGRATKGKRIRRVPLFGIARPAALVAVRHYITMKRSRSSVAGLVYLPVALLTLGGCSAGSIGPGIAGADGTHSGSGGASGGAISGSEPDAGSPDHTIGDRDASVGTPEPGTCPSGFVRCSGLCLESAIMGADCNPVTCPVSIGTPPERTSITARGFDWNVVLDGPGVTVTFKPGKGGGALAPTIAVDFNYRVNDAPPLLSATMIDTGDSTFRFQTANLKDGDNLDFYFHQTVAPQTLINPGPGGKPLIDTMWFHQIVGRPRDPEPAYPLTVKLAGRFRDRHPNEERYDHFVDTYFAGPTFDLTLIDHGDSVDVTIAPQASMNVEAVDFKNYECFGSGMGGAIPSPTPLCYTPPALAAVGVRATNMGNSVFTTKVDQLSYGQLLDFELTFVRSRTYYTEWFQYFVGSGRLQPKVQHPWAHAAGDQSVTDVTVDEFGYAQHVPNLTPAELANFIAGKVLFEADFQTHVGYNPPTTYDCPRGLTPGTPVPTIVTAPPRSPLFTAGNSYTNMALATIARPGDTASACFSCHHLDGKGGPPDDKGMGSMLLKLFSANGSSAEPDPMYGTILDQRNPSGGAPEVKAAVRWETITGSFADGTPYELRKPVVALNGLRDGALSPSTHLSARIPRPVFGLGFIEAVAEETIVALADPDDANNDGISGRPNYVTDAATGAKVLGRFGWKAGISSLREQAALAFVNDIGVTSPLYPKHRCGIMQTACRDSAPDAAPQLSDTDLDHIQSYLRGLSVPPRRNYDDPQAIAGKALFAGIGCIKCHVPNLVTSSKYAVPEMRNIDIQPFTDLLLHDMGDGLADDAPVEEGTATGREWRTCPLWGNGTGAAVMYPAIDAFDPNGHPPPGGVYLHDGRARSITEAILWHGGEAVLARNIFVSVSASQRAALLAYVAYPFADPVIVRRCSTPASVSP